MKQLSFIQKTKVEYGGTLLKGKRKSARPIDTKRAQHFVLKAADTLLLLKNRKLVEGVTRKTSKQFGVRLYSMGVHMDHIHLNVRFLNRLLYRRWIRALTSRLVSKIPGLKFVLRPYSTIVNWGRQFKRLLNYIRFNALEGDLISEAYAKIDRHKFSYAKIYAL